MQDDDADSLEDIVAREQIAEELWQKANGDSGTSWRALPEAAKAS